MSVLTNETPVAYHRRQHAAHYMGGVGGHDLEIWNYAQHTRLPVPSAIPADAEYHVGFIEGGAQWWSYTRVAPLTGRDCPRCAENGARHILSVRS